MWFLYLLSKQDSAPLVPAVMFILEYLSTGDRFQLLSLGPIHLLPQIPPERRGPHEIFTGKMKAEGLSSVASSGWHGAYRPYLIGAMQLLPYLVEGPQGDFCCYSGRVFFREQLESMHHHYPVVPSRKQAE